MSIYICNSNLSKIKTNFISLNGELSFKTEKNIIHRKTIILILIFIGITLLFLLKMELYFQKVIVIIILEIIIIINNKEEKKK